uniref:Uncharacterized protein n=2 Tax=Caenorhabditis japonica TaxID=281687 RepID=A0A8R1EIS9_CAEJA
MGEHMEAVAAEEAPPPSVSFQEEEEDPRDIIPIEQRSQSSLHYELNGLPGAGDSRRRAEAIDAEDDDSEISDLNNAFVEDGHRPESHGSEIL